MPLPIIAGVTRISVGGPIRGGGNWSNTWHIKTTDSGDPTGAQLAAARDAFADFYAVQVLGRCAPGTTLSEMVMTPLDGTSGGVTFSLNIQGSDTFETVPPQNAQVLTLRTALRGRRHRGRVYLPAFTVSSYDGDGRLMASVRDAILLGVQPLLTALFDSGQQLGVASYGRSVNRLGVVTTWPPEWTLLSAATMDLLADVQRSRKQ